MIPARIALELDGLFDVVRRFISSPLGERRLAAYVEQPLSASADEARAELDTIGEAMNWLRASEAPDRRGLSPVPRFLGLQDVTGAARKLRAEGAVLEAAEIYALLELLDRAEETRQRLWRERAHRPRLGEQGDRLAEFAPLLRELSGKILASGEVSDLASSTLSRIRRQIEQQRQNVHRSLENFVRQHFGEGVLQDDYATIRNGRSVVPVKASWKGRVEGVIHAASSTGQTVFVEPLETIVQNNRLVQLLEEEQREILRILREITDRLRQDREAVEEAVTTLAELELLFAKARFGEDFRCCLPRFSSLDQPEFRFERARHPLLEDVLRREGRKVRSLSIALSGDRRILVVSGPNAGGKTVVLKTVGLLALAARCALPLPADAAVVPWFERVLADIGDAQSIEASLSTFSAHIQKLKEMIEAATGDSLVLIDEIGAATDPQEGGAFAVAVVDHFLDKGAFALVTTHLPALKVYAANRDHIVSAAMGFDDNTLSPTYKLLVGVPGESAGLAMAERLGVPADVIGRARRALIGHEEEASAFLGQLRRKVEELEAARRELRLGEQRLRERERELERQAEEREQRKIRELERRFAEKMREAETANRTALEEALEKIERAQESRRASVQAQRTAARAQREARERLQAASAEALGRPQKTATQPATGEIVVGAEVRLGGFGAKGRVLRALGADRWEVQVGALKMQVGRDDISEILGQPADRREELPAGVTFHSAPRESESPLHEINVIGKRADEAQAAVDKFLDEAVLADVRRLRVIHGHGANVLRRSLWQMFANHVHVERYYQADQNEGGAGATIVEVRE